MNEKDEIIIKKKLKVKPKEKQQVIKLVFPENLLKSLNKIQKKQNNELMKIISEDKSIPLKTLLIFQEDRLTETINVNSNVKK
jgi:hypothetical protein